MNKQSISGQIIELYDQGYTPQEIHLELKQRPGLNHLTKSRVDSVLRQLHKRSLDSRRIFEVYEMCLEILALCREMARYAERRRTDRHVRALDKYGIAGKIGSALDAIEPVEPGKTA
jgi:hypothetical protein